MIIRNFTSFMKKRILFVVTYLDTGGISRALQNFLNCYDTSLYGVDVFAMAHQGVYQGNLKNCVLLPPDRMINAAIGRYEHQRGITKVESLVCKIIDKVSGYRFHNYLLRKAGKKLVEKAQYDAVIGFSEGLPTLFVSMMKHPNRIGWIHCDYANYLKVGSGKLEQDIYESLQSVVCVSEFTRETFIKIYPSLSDRTYAIYNILDDKMMRSKSSEPIDEPFDDSCFNIVSIGRIDPVKRLSIVPELACKITDAGCKIRWYVIGPKGTDGELQLLLENRSKYQMEEVVLLLGEKANPYPYIAQADLLVNTSISEACPYVINEAKILGTPVVCTDFGSAKEFVDNGRNGYCESIGDMADRIIWLVQNPNRINGMRECLSHFAYDNTQILRKIDTLI